MDELKNKVGNPSEYGYTYLTPREQPPAEVGWKEKEADDKKGIVNLYSQNVLKEGNTTESVDRESIANLSTTKQQWESIFTSNLKTTEDEVSNKKKLTPKWEVKLSAPIRGTVGGTGNGGSGHVRLDCERSQTDNNSVSLENNNNNNCDGEYNNNNEKDDTMYNNSVNGGTQSAIGQYESAIEYEIRVAQEREEMLRREKEQRELLLTQTSSSVATTQKTSSPMTLSSMEVVNGESESYQPAYNELAEADRERGVWSLSGGVVRSEERNENKAEDPNESIIEREIRLQREKEAEIERQRLMLGQQVPSLSSSSTSSLHSTPQQDHDVQGHVSNGQISVHSPSSDRLSPVVPNVIRPNNTPPNQESIIARELRELQEREDEMRRLRSRVHGVDIQKTESQSVNVYPSSPSNESYNNKSASINVTSSNNVFKQAMASPSPASPNTQGTWQREVSPFVSQNRRVSVDSGSSHSVSKSSDTAATPSRSISVQPIADGAEGSDDDEKPNYFKKQETPIEREMRIAKERENELRRMKGMPELATKDDFYGSYGGKGSKTNNNTSPNKPMGYHAPSQQSLKKVSTSRLQQEISAQKERENSLKNEGIIVSDSGEQLKPFKYMEVIGSQPTDGAVKRNFTTKKTSVSSPQPPEVQKSSEVPSQMKASVGAKKGLGGGSQNFSYKEFKQTAESKIERELREMREREEELRNQRKLSTAQTPR